MKFAINNNNEIFIYNNDKIVPLENKIIKNNISLSLKEKCLLPKSMIMVNKLTGDIIFETKELYPQHFYPHTILDYANALKNSMNSKEEYLPIMSISAKDYPFCDFKCRECLADPTRDWAINNLCKHTLDLDEYKNILKEIARYSKKRGLDSVRLEFCGEGNPDLYKYRSEIIEYAKKECNMGVVYISTGSKLDDRTIDALVKYASYIRISLPGINPEAYEYYSNQKTNDKFTFNDAMKLLKKLCNLRKKYNREGELMIGVRTCIRKKNEGCYISLSKRIAKMGVDSFQAVKVLSDKMEDKQDIELSAKTKKELIKLNNIYQEIGLKHLQTPKLLDKLYINREFVSNRKPTKCFSSILSPILYGNTLMVCIHWDKIRDKENAHYGILRGEPGELEEIMNGEKALEIRKQYPTKCHDCCSLNDNLMLEVIRSNLALFNDLSIIDFMLVY